MKFYSLPHKMISLPRLERCRMKMETKLRNIPAASRVCDY